ncbi:MAG TPA: twin transmembrane helix small protein [Gammaproteobacteria bacterium]|jgi:Na+/pantothenate symporter|nr:twin transmembrane helix small protein [Gammaproteobacteria bacterium]
MTIVIKGIIIALLVFIFFSLGSALYYLVRDPSQSTRVVKALTWRISLSVVLFIFLMAAFAMGWITPHSIS